MNVKKKTEPRNDYEWYFEHESVSEISIWTSKMEQKLNHEDRKNDI